MSYRLAFWDLGNWVRTKIKSVSDTFKTGWKSTKNLDVQAINGENKYVGKNLRN